MLSLWPGQRGRRVVQFAWTRTCSLASGKEKFHPYDDSSHVAVLSKSAYHENIAFQSGILASLPFILDYKFRYYRTRRERDSTLFEKHHMGFFIWCMLVLFSRPMYFML